MPSYPGGGRLASTRRREVGTVGPHRGAAIIAGAIGQDTALRQVARPILERLRDDTNESTRLAVAEREEFVIIERVECTRDVRIHDEFGHHGPNYATDLGKAILAFSTKEERERLLPRRLTAFTDLTITDRASLNRELEFDPRPAVGNLHRRGPSRRRGCRRSRPERLW